MAEINPVRLMQNNNVDQVVRVHLQAFPGFYLSFLSSSFLTEYSRAALGKRYVDLFEKVVHENQKRLKNV